MQLFSRRQIIVVLLIFAIAGIGVFVFAWKQRMAEPASMQFVEENAGPEYRVIGTSVQGRKIEAYTYGNGDTNLLFVGGIHGGYEWNSVLLAYQFMDYLAGN